jgi:hypothetical protein
MANEASIKRRVDRAKAEWETYSAQLFRQHLEWRDAQRHKARVGGLFPSTEPGGRGATSPLGGLSPDEAWSGKRKT